MKIWYSWLLFEHNTTPLCSLLFTSYMVFSELETIWLWSVLFLCAPVNAVTYYGKNSCENSTLLGNRNCYRLSNGDENDAHCIWWKGARGPNQYHPIGQDSLWLHPICSIITIPRLSCDFILTICFLSDTDKREYVWEIHTALVWAKKVSFQWEYEAVVIKLFSIIYK